MSQFPNFYVGCILCMHVYAGAHGGQRKTLGVLLYCCLSPLRQGLLLNLELIILVELVGMFPRWNVPFLPMMGYRHGKPALAFKQVLAI